MMDSTETLQRLSKIVVQVLGDGPAILTPATTADDVAGWDSFNHVNIIVGVELEFGIKFKASELEALKNVGDFVSAIDKRLSEKK